VSDGSHSFEAFRAAHLAQGFDEVLVREWAPGQVVAEHTHPFDVKAQVVRGCVHLSCREGVRTLTAGEGFELRADEPHAEHYGPDGATFWVARRTPPPPAD
jgi:quercetin dioxygenase-like cupin family protein